MNDRSIWLDAWQDTLRLMRTPDWHRIGLRLVPPAALAPRSGVAPGQRSGADAGSALLHVGAGGHRGNPGPALGQRRRPPSSGSPPAWRCWRWRPAASSIGIAAVTAPRSSPCCTSAAGSLLAFALGGQGVGGVATRFVLPLVVLFVPFAAHALVTHVWPRLRPSSRRRVPGAAARDQARRLRRWSDRRTRVARSTSRPTGPRRRPGSPTIWSRASATPCPTAAFIRPGINRRPIPTRAGLTTTPRRRRNPGRHRRSRAALGRAALGRPADTDPQDLRRPGGQRSPALSRQARRAPPTPTVR